MKKKKRLVFKQVSLLFKSISWNNLKRKIIYRSHTMHDLNKIERE